MYTNGCNGGCQFVSSEIFFFFPSRSGEIRLEEGQDRVFTPSRGMIYHRDVPLKSFLPETVPCKTGLPLPPPLTPCRCNLVFSANVSALVPRSKWIPNELWTLGWWKDRFQIWTSLLSRDVCQCWNFYSYEFLFCLVFFWFSIFFFSRIQARIWWYRYCCTTRPLRKYLSCSRIGVVIFFFFFLEISCKYFQMSRIIIEILTDNWIFTSVKSTIDKYKIYYIINNL